MHHERNFFLSLLDLDRLLKELRPVYKFVLREKFFPLLFTDFCLDLSIMLDVTSDRSIFLSCY